MDLINDLNSLLANLAVFYRKLQNYHWNIKGKDFFIVHSKLEEYYNGINEQIDEIGEHILIMGGQPLATLKDYLELSKIKEAQNEKLASDIIYNNVLNDFNTLLELSIELKKKAEQNNDYATSVVIDNFILDYSKKIWMLRQSME